MCLFSWTWAVAVISKKCARRGSGRRCKYAAMRRQTSVGQVVHPNVTSRISASLTMSQESLPLAVTPNCWPIARTSSSPKSVISYFCTECNLPRNDSAWLGTSSYWPESDNDHSAGWPSSIRHHQSVGTAANQSTTASTARRLAKSAYFVYMLLVHSTVLHNCTLPWYRFVFFFEFHQILRPSQTCLLACIFLSLGTSPEPSSWTIASAHWILGMVLLNSCSPFACFWVMFWHCNTSLMLTAIASLRSVFDTFVQLTEGRSVRDIPKQPPAKKTVWHIKQVYIDVLTRKPRADVPDEPMQWGISPMAASSMYNSQEL